ncbi:hypothetical protein L195_g059359, partial [Trifolium pratense]
GDEFDCGADSVERLLLSETLSVEKFAGIVPVPVAVIIAEAEAEEEDEDELDGLPSKGTPRWCCCE